MNVKYKKLATVSLLHDYYDDKKCTDFKIVPAPQTLDVLKNIGAVYKISGHQLLIFARVDENGKAFIPVPDTASFVFYMISENPLFTNISNIAQKPAANLRYYFTNKAFGQLTGTDKYLNHHISAYSSGSNYQVGDLVIDGSGEVLEAIQSSQGVVLTDPQTWAHRAANTVSYVNNNDLLEFVSPVYNYTLGTAAKKIEVNAYKYDAAGTPAKVVTLTQDFTTAKTTGSVLLDMLPPGYYNIEVKDRENASNTTAKKVYLDAEALYRNVFGVIELQAIADGSRLALFNANGTLALPEFRIRFAPRSVVWKYLATRNLGNITYGSNDFYSETESGYNSYKSNFPILLQQRHADDVESDLAGILPPPAVSSFGRTMLQNNLVDTYLCIEKYLP